jgi:hypothetical protein
MAPVAARERSRVNNSGYTNEPKRAHFERALYRLREKPFEYVMSRKILETQSKAMDEDAKRKWAAMGMPESTRPWKR